MSFLNINKPHDIGVKSEEFIMMFLNNLNELNKGYLKSVFNKENYHFKCVGGTKNCVDIKEINNNISISLKTIKRHQKDNNFFNLFNFSNIKIPNISYKFQTSFDGFNYLIENHKDCLLKTPHLKGDEAFKLQIQNDIDNYFNETLNQLDIEDVKSMFNYYMKNYCDYILLRSYNDEAKVNIKDLDFLLKQDLINEFYKVDFDQVIISNKHSFRLHYKDEFMNETPHFRVRVNLSNGINAYLRQIGFYEKQSKKNNHSTITIKLMVHQPSKLFEKYKSKNTN